MNIINDSTNPTDGRQRGNTLALPIETQNIGDIYEHLQREGVGLALVSSTFPHGRPGPVRQKAEAISIPDLQATIQERMKEGAIPVFTVYLGTPPPGKPKLLRRFYDSLAKAVGARCDLCCYDSEEETFSQY